MCVFMFRGRMIIHLGRRNNHGPTSPQLVPRPLWKLFIVRHELPGEAYLAEVPASAESLRSRTCFLLVSVETGCQLLWHGAKSLDHIRQRARDIASRLGHNCPLELFDRDMCAAMLTEMYEGTETAQFIQVIGGVPRLLNDGKPKTDYPDTEHTLRLFHLSSVTGVFEAVEVLNPCRNEDGVCSAYPLLQSDLYSASQPALMLIDAGSAVYLWQGCWPSDLSNRRKSDSIRTGSAESRFNIDRCCALQTTINYCTQSRPDNPQPGYLIYAGLEPSEFRNLFPFWTMDDMSAEINLQEGHHPGELVPVADRLARLTQNRYTWEELQERPLPTGVDLLKLESYLTDEEFEEVIGSSRDEFYTMPAWKQANVKKELGLF
jgi:supervillin